MAEEVVSWQLSVGSWELAATESQVGQKSFIGGISHFSFPADSITLLSKCRLPPALLAHSQLTTGN